MVDVTNYVMLELGRPLHVYDLDKLRGPIVVRWGLKGEKVLLLNEQEVEVDESVLCITDDSGVIGLGGIMGGRAPRPTTLRMSSSSRRSSIPTRSPARAPLRFRATPRTASSAAWISGTMSTASSARRGSSSRSAAASPARPWTRWRGCPRRKPVTMRVSRAQKVIGVPVPAKDMAGAFKRLGFLQGELRRFQRRSAVLPLRHRIEEDLIEEVARLYGFERIAAQPRWRRRRCCRFPRHAGRHALRERLAAADYREVINFSFVEPGWEADFAGESNLSGCSTPSSASNR